MKAKNEPNVVPLCDILLVLLIIFMVITPTAQMGMDIRLPITGPGGDGSSKVILTVEPEGVYKVNVEEYQDIKMVEKRLFDIYEHRNDRTLYVKGHKSVPYRDMIEAMDTARAAGVNTICVIAY